MSSRRLVIAIDGPAGAGKSTIAKLLAKELGLQYLDTGAMYRALAYSANESGIDREDGEGAAALLAQLTISFGGGDPQRVLVNGVDVTTSIRTPEIGDLASAFSAFSSVRRAMVARQQKIVEAGGVVLEGRDATTVIAPEADLKVYLTASLEERARRRLSDFGKAGDPTAFEEVRQQIQVRDHRDITRADSPLTVADGAQIIDSANLTVDQVLERFLALVDQLGLPQSKR